VAALTCKIEKGETPKNGENGDGPIRSEKSSSCPVEKKEQKKGGSFSNWVTLVATKKAKRISGGRGGIESSRGTGGGSLRSFLVRSQGGRELSVIKPGPQSRLSKRLRAGYRKTHGRNANSTTLGRLLTQPLRKKTPGRSLEARTPAGRKAKPPP